MISLPMVGTYWRIQTTTNGEDSRALPRVSEVAGHVTRRRSLIGQFKIRANSAEGNISTILPTPILPSRTRHHGIKTVVFTDIILCW